MTSCTFENNSSADLGGGLFNRGSMVVSGSVFRDNLGRVSLGSLFCFNEYEFFLNDVFFPFLKGGAIGNAPNRIITLKRNIFERNTDGIPLFSHTGM